MVLYYLLLVSVNAISQDSFQNYSYGGKKLQVSSKYDCSEKYTLTSSDFALVNVKIPKLVYNASDTEELIEVFSEGLEDEITVIEKRRIEFKSFGQEFRGYLYKIREEGKTRLMISSFGIIKDAINLTIGFKDENIDFDHFKFPSELIDLIDITDLK
jgi:hypothetical protein